VRGTVTSVNGQTVMVANSSAAPTAVPVNNETSYFRQASTSALVITQGACLSAVGTLDPSGALQATTATVGPLANGSCPGA